MAAQRRPLKDAQAPVSGEYRMVSRRRSLDAIEAVRPPPKRHVTVEIPAIEPSNGRMLDDELGFDLDADGLELDIPLAEAPISSHRREVPPLSSIDHPPPSSQIRPVDPHAVFTAFAKFGEPPRTIWQTPGYALRVMKRRRVLEREMESVRRRASKDVALYEAALRTADNGSVQAGIAVMTAMGTLGILLAVAVWQVVSGALGF